LLYKALWVEIAVDVVLTEPETIHRDPMAQSFHLIPHFRVPLLDPCLDVGLLLAVGSAVEPAAETAELSAMRTEDTLRLNLHV
jgi:hypothetical protein